MKLLTYACALPLLLAVTPIEPVADVPKTILSNELITAEILLPDKDKGYYRGVRFDWSGVISRLEYKGHSFFGKWFERYDPLHHDAIMGPVDEFREPLGFDEANAGQEFVKVGVGVLKKQDDAPYSFSKKYELTNPGIWNVRQQKGKVIFSQELSGVNGYSYYYEKTLSLAADAPILSISHRLVNTGRREIRTNTYNHNFFMIDREPTGPGILTTFGFDIQADGRGFGDIAHAHNRTITYNRQLQKGEHVFSADLRVSKHRPVIYSFAVENLTTGAGVKVRGDKPVDTMIYWASPSTACPEPYIDIVLEPGKSIEWLISYEFYTKA